MNSKRRLAGQVTALIVVMFGIVAGASGASLGTWHDVKSGTGSDIEAVAFGNNTFVAVGAKGLILTSQDGVKWAKRSAGISRDFNDVTFSSGRFIAVCKAPDAGVGAKIWVSDSNGASWKYRDTDAEGDTISVGLHAVAGDGSGNLVAVGGIGWITRSHDNGQTWQVLTSKFTFGSLYGVAWGKGVWIATGPSGVFRSTDTNAWTTATETFPAYKAGFGNNRFVVTADGFGAGCKSSSDGNKWTQCTKAAPFAGDSWPGYSNGVAFADGLFAVSGGNGDVWTSETGLVWKRWSSPLTGTQLMGAAFGQRMFIAAGYDGRLVASPPWMKARLGSTWDHPFTVFDAEDAAPRRLGLPEYRVNTASLNVGLEAVFFYMPTLGVPVNLRLVYGSAPTPDDADSIGLFGKNWRFRYESVIGQFGPEAHVVTGGGRTHIFGTPQGQDLATATLGNPLTLIAPDGVFDELKFFGPGQYFELKEKASKLTLRYAVAGGPGNALWRLTRITDPSGNQVNLDVTGTNGRINSITDSASRTVTFNYDTARNLCTRLTAPDGRHIDFTYDDHKNLTGITDMAGYAGAYVYDEKGYLLRMTTAGRVTSFTYAERPGYEEKEGTPPDGEGAGDQILASVVNSRGDTVRYELLPKDEGVKRTDARGNATVFRSEAGQTAQVADPLSRLRSVQFNAAKLPVAFTDELGQTTAYEYDVRGNATQLTDAEGNATRFSYDGRDNVLTRVNALGKTWSYGYDASDRPTSVTSPLGNATLITYFANGRINTMRDPRDAITTFQNDGFGNVTRVTDPLGGFTQLGYDALGLRCTTITDPRGKVKTLLHDANDRITRVIYTSVPGQPERVNAFDAFGQTSFTDELGKTTTVERDDFGLPTAVTDPLGHVTHYEYDPESNPVRLTDPLGRVTSATYDSANRPLVFTDTRGKTIEREYDDAGNLTALTDKKGNKTTFAYDANHRLVETRDPLGTAVTHTRDALGRVSITTNARDQQVRFLFDDDGRLASKAHKNPGDTNFTAEATFGHDANGNVINRADDWGATAYSYDANNRVSAITYPSGAGAAFTYNAAGLPATVTYPGGLVVTYTYDDFNRIQPQSAETIGGAEPQPQVTQVQMSLGGNVRTIAYSYNVAGQPTLIDRPNGVDTTYTFDDAQRVTALQHAGGGGTLLRWDFTLDAASNLLASAASGSLVLPEPLPAPASLAYNKANQLTKRNAATYTYDADGNLTAVSGGALSATYTAENRPTQLSRMAGGAVTYTYDGNGLRVKRAVAGGATVQFHYDAQDRLLFTTDGPGAVLTRYIWKGATLAAIVTGPSLLTDLRFPLQDHLGSVAAVTDPAGASEAGYAYQAYGAYFRQQQLGASDPGLFTFIGGLGVQDEGEGLFYMKNRFYDAITGRFLQKDPTGFRGGVNLYAYALANPHQRLDPRGTEVMGDPPEPEPQVMSGTYDIEANKLPTQMKDAEASEEELFVAKVVLVGVTVAAAAEIVLPVAAEAFAAAGAEAAATGGAAAATTAGTAGATTAAATTTELTTTWVIADQAAFFAEREAAGSLVQGIEYLMRYRANPEALREVGNILTKAVQYGKTADVSNKLRTLADFAYKIGSGMIP